MSNHFLAVILIPQCSTVLFKFNATAPSLHGFVLVAQLLTQISSTKTILATVTITNSFNYNLVYIWTLFSAVIAVEFNYFHLNE